MLLIDDDGLLQELRNMVKKLSNDVKYNREKIETIEEIVETNGKKLDHHLNPPGKQKCNVFINWKFWLSSIYHDLHLLDSARNLNLAACANPIFKCI